MAAVPPLSSIYRLPMDHPRMSIQSVCLLSLRFFLQVAHAAPCTPAPAKAGFVLGIEKFFVRGQPGNLRLHSDPLPPFPTAGGIFECIRDLPSGRSFSPNPFRTVLHRHGASFLQSELWRLFLRCRQFTGCRWIIPACPFSLFVCFHCAFFCRWLTPPPAPRRPPKRGLYLVLRSFLCVVSRGICVCTQTHCRLFRRQVGSSSASATCHRGEVSPRTPFAPSFTGTVHLFCSLSYGCCSSVVVNLPFADGSSPHVHSVHNVHLVHFWWSTPIKPEFAVIYALSPFPCKKKEAAVLQQPPSGNLMLKIDVEITTI